MLKVGSVVVVEAGRDKGMSMAVLRIDEAGVWIADGRARRIQHPKRKNPRHVSETEGILSDMSMATNRALRRALRGAGETLEGG